MNKRLVILFCPFLITFVYIVFTGPKGDNGDAGAQGKHYYILNH